MKLLAATTAVLLAACHAGAPAAPTEATTGYLVWTSPEGGAVTRWLDGDGREQGHAAGIWVAAGGALWRIDRTARKLVTTGCAHGGDDEAVEPGEATLTDLVATASGADGATAQVIVRIPDKEADEYASYDHVVTVAGGLGSVLFAEESVDEYACGAHGGVMASAFTYDLDTRTRHEAPAAPAGPELRAEVEAALTAEEIEPFEPDAPARIGDIYPVWRAGVLGTRTLAYVDTCYACGNGEWSSYTSGVWLDDVRIPDDWPAASAVPAAVAHAIGAPAPVAHGVSWGAPDARWRATFTAR